MCCVASPDIDLDNIDPGKIEWSMDRQTQSKVLYGEMKEDERTQYEAIWERQTIGAEMRWSLDLLKTDGDGAEMSTPRYSISSSSSSSSLTHVP